MRRITVWWCSVLLCIPTVKSVSPENSCKFLGFEHHRKIWQKACIPVHRPALPSGVKQLPEPVALVAEAKHCCTVFRPSSNTTNGFTGTWSLDMFMLGCGCLSVRDQEVHGKSAATQEQTEHCTGGAAQDVKMKSENRQEFRWMDCLLC